MKFRNSRVFLILLTGLAILFVHPVFADKVSGIFSAQQSCPAFVSKNKSTNPDNAQILAGNRYAIIEAGKSNPPAWYRIVLPRAKPEARWISAACGQAQITAGDTGDNESGESDNNCNTAGQADSYVLALSWQPAFCETKPDKPECEITDPNAYHAKHFALHGLWPNKKNCNKNYAFCGIVKKKKDEFCDYPEIQLDSASQASLAEVMPSVIAGSCLERHEWHKHGSCQENWPVSEFFDLSTDLARQFNDSGMAYFMNRRINQQVRTEDFLNRLEAVLGFAARDRIKLNCNQQGMMVEIQLSLSGDLIAGADLEKLIMNAPVQEKSNCGETFRVDRIGQ
ncbi:MAG: ribonuclease T [Nitrosomonas ureae]